MKKALFIFAAILMMGISAQKSYAQLSDEEYNYVTMDLRGILNLTMTTNPQIDFTFKTIQEYNLGITRFNATYLEVDATLAWDLYTYASTDFWNQVESYSTNGNPDLPAEVLELKSSVPNAFPGANADQVFDDFRSLKGKTNSGVLAAGPDAAKTQFLAGCKNAAAAPVAGENFAPGTAANNPSTHKFRIDMRLKPSIPATWPNSTETIGATTVAGPSGSTVTFTQAGYYYLEVVYALVEDL